MGKANNLSMGQLYHLKYRNPFDTYAANLGLQGKFGLLIIEGLAKKTEPTKVGIFLQLPKRCVLQNQMYYSMQHSPFCVVLY